MRKDKLLTATLAATALFMTGVNVACAEDVSTWEGLKTGLTTGGNFTVTGDITDANSVVSGKTSELNLNNKTLSGASGVTSGLSFNGQDLTLTGGGTISSFYRPDTDPSRVDGSEYGILDLRKNANLTMTDGDWTFSGNTSGVGSINTLNSSVSANVDKIVFKDNVSNAQSAGLRHQVSDNAYRETSVTITANEIIFNNNEIKTVVGLGTAKVGSGAAVMNCGGTLNLYGAENTFTGNKMNAEIASERAYKVGGGAVINQSHQMSNNGPAIDSTMVIGKDDGSSINTFSGNTSSTNGGAVMNRAVDDDGDATLTIYGDTKFENNTATESGGAIYNIQHEGRTATVNLNKGYYVFKDNTAGINGGAIYNAGNLTITEKSLFEGNSSASGGAIFHNDGKLTIDNATFENNAVYGISRGGAIFNTSVLDSSISNSVFSCNYTNSELDGIGGLGGAIYNQSKLTLQNDIFSNNGKIVDEEDNIIVKTEFGGAIYNNSGELNIKGGSITGNIAKTGGAIYNKATLNIEGTTISYNNASASNGGGIYNNKACDINIESTKFENNTAYKEGGAIYNKGTITLNGNNTFSGNKVGENKNDIYNAGTLNLNGTTNLEGGISGNGTINLGESSITSTFGEEQYGTSKIYASTINVTNGAKISFDWGDQIFADAINAEAGVKLGVDRVYVDLKQNNPLEVTAYALFNPEGIAYIDLDADQLTKAFTGYSGGKKYTLEQQTTDKRYVGFKEEVGTASLTKAVDDTTDGVHTVDYELQSGGETYGSASATEESRTISGNTEFTISGANASTDKITAADNSTKGMIVSQNAVLSLNKTQFNNFKADDNGAIENNGKLNLDNVIFSDNNVAVKNNSGATVNSSDTDFGAKIINEGNFNIEYTDEYSPTTTPKTVTTDLIGTNGKVLVSVENGATVNWKPVNQAVQNEFTFDGSGHLALGGAGFKGNVINKMTGDTLEITSLIDGAVNSTSDPAGQNHISITGNGAVTGLITNSGKLDILTDTTYIIQGGIADVATPSGTTNIGDTTHNVVASLAADQTIVQKNINIASGSKLSAAAGKISATNFTNSGTYVVNGGADADHYVDNALAVSGDGKTQVTGFVAQNAAISSTSTDADALSIGSGAGLKITGDNLQAKTTNAGTLNITNGTIAKAIAGAGTLKTADGVAIASTANVTQGTLNVTGTLTNNSNNLTVTKALVNGSTSKITNNGILKLAGTETLTPFESSGTIDGSGRLVIGDGSDKKTLLSLVNEGTISNYIEITANSELDADPDKLTVTDHNLINDGVLELTAGTINFSVNNSSPSVTTGHTDIVGNYVNFGSPTDYSINQQINILNTSSVTDDHILVANGANIGGKVVMNDASETKDNILRLIGGEMSHNIEGVTVSEVTTYGDLDITGDVTYSGTSAHVSDLSITAGKTLTNSGAITVHDDLDMKVDGTTLAQISNTGTLNLLNGEASDTMKNAGTISGTGNVNIGSATENAYVENTGAGSITGNITIAQGSTLKSAANNVTDTNGIDNKGALNLSGSTGTETAVNMTSAIIDSQTTKTGVTNIAGNVATNGNNITQATVNIGSDGTATPVAAILTNNATIDAVINITSQGALTTATSGLTTTSDIKNDGLLKFTDTTATGTIAQNIIKSTSGGTVEIAGGENTVFSLASGKSITNQTLKLTSGTYNAGTATGAVYLTNFTSIIANGGTLSVQDSHASDVNLGKINTDASALKIAIDADLANTQGDTLKLAEELGTAPKNIQISSIRAISDPTATVFEFQIADDNTKAHIDMTSTTISSADGLTPSIGNLLLTYDSSSGKLKGTHSNLASAITSTIPTKVYSMTASSTEQIGALTLGGGSLSITGNGSSIISSTTPAPSADPAVPAINGITLGAATQQLSITGATIGSETNYFATAINNEIGGTVDLTDVTFKGNTTDVANAGTLNTKGTNSINTITGAGTMNVKDGTTTVNTSLAQGTVNVGDSSVDPATNATLVSKCALNVTTLDVKTAGSKFTNEGGTTATPAAITTLTNAGTVENKGQLTVGTFDNNNILSNASDSVLTATTINNSGSITNAAAGSGTGSVAGVIAAAITNDDDGASITNAGTITGSITNTADKNNITITNSGTITGNVNNGNGTGNVITNSATGLIQSGTLTNAGGTVNNTAGGLISSAIVNNSGTLNTLASRVTGGVTNDGTVRLTGNSTATPDTGTLGSNISNGTAGTGETFILGTINTPTGKAIAQATVNIGEVVGSTETAGTLTNAGKATDTPTAGGITANKINITANSALNNTGDVSVANKLTNAGTVSNTGSGVIKGAGSVDNSGTLNTTASGVTVTGGIDNKGTTNLSGSTGTAAAQNLGTSITSSDKKGNVNIAGNVATNGKNITDQKSVVVGNNGTAAVTGSSLTVSSGSLLTTDSTNGTGNVDVTAGNTLALATGSTTNIAGALAVATGGTLDMTGTAALTANGVTITDGNLNLHDATLNTAVTGAGTTGVDVNVDGTGTTNISAAIKNVINDVEVASGATLALNDNGTITHTDSSTGTPAQVGTTIALGADTTGANGAKLDVNSTSSRTLDNKVTATPGAGSSVNVNKKVGSTGTVTLDNTLTGVDDVNVVAGNAQIGATGDTTKTSTSDTIGNADLNIASGATATIDATNTATTNNAYTIDNDVDGENGSGKLVLSGNTPDDTTTPTKGDVGTTFSIANGTRVTNAAVDLQDGQLNVEDGLAFTNSTIAAAADTTINAMNGSNSTFGNITFADDSMVKADVDVASQVSDNFAGATGSVVLTDVNIANLDKIVVRNTDINLRDKMGLPNLTVSDELQGQKFQAMTPIRIMEATMDQTGMLNVHPSSGNNDWRSYNPAVMVGPIAAQLGGYLTQLNSYDQAFANMDMYMLMTKKQRQALKFRNKISSVEGGNIAFDPTMRAEDHAGGWFRPYATFEKVHLHNAPKVENTAYGSFFGGESSMKDLGNGWDGMWGAYVGYNGSHQSYTGTSIYQNGGTLGLVGMAYKDNFFVGTTVNVGANAGEADSYFGNEHFSMLMAGIAAKTGYNWELADGKFIIQPSFQMSYSFINTFNYTNAAGVRINSDPLNAIQIEPGIKFIGNLKNGWQPYAGVSVVINLMDRTSFQANDITLPHVGVNPFVKYGVGVRKSWGERFTGFFQTFLMSGGRAGVGLQAGFRWSIGRDSGKNISTKGSTPKMSQTKVNISSAK